MPRTLSRDALVVDRTEYARQRRAERERIIALRSLRRVSLGDRLVLEFENFETLQYQVQEMVYAEAITAESEISDEIVAYSRMLPTSHELSATLFVELPDMQNIRDDLSAVKSAPHNILLRVGDDLVASRELTDPDETPPS